MLVLRVLNGPLFGAEVALPRGGCFIRVVDLDTQSVDPAVEQGIDVMTKDAMLTIPFAGPSPNFRLIPDVDEHGSCTLRAEVYESETGVVEREIPLNEPVTIGGLHVAVRGADEMWSTSVSRYRGSVEVQPEAPPPKSRRERLAAIAATIAGAAGLASLVWAVWPASTPDVASLLAGQPYQVVASDVRHVYVFAENVGFAGNVRRQLARVGAAQVQVLVRAEEAARIGAWLEAAGIRHFSVDLEDPCRPVLRLRRKADQDPVVPVDLDARLHRVAPYSTGMKVEWRTEEDAQRAARSVVDEVGVRVSYHTTPDHFVVLIDDYLNDAKLDAFSRALDAYQRAWGREYARFLVNQRDMISIDGLKTGPSGYELRSSRHIYFPTGSTSS